MTLKTKLVPVVDILLAFTCKKCLQQYEYRVLKTIKNGLPKCEHCHIECDLAETATILETT